MAKRKPRLTPEEVNTILEQIKSIEEYCRDNKRRLVYKLTNGLSKTETALLLKIDRKTLYERYFGKP